MTVSVRDTEEHLTFGRRIAVRIAESLRSAAGAFDPDRLDRRDAALVARLEAISGFLNEHYLGLQTEGFDELPEGPALYVGNHNGGIAGPDLCCTLGTLWRARGPEAPLYALAHDFVMRQISPVGALLQRLGGLRATPEVALRALAAGAQVLVYPGGDLDAYRHARRSDTIVLGPRTGFVRVAQEAGVPIVPIVAQGAHRSAYIFSEGERIAQLLSLKRWARLERFPLAFALPWGVAVGPWLPYFPLPFPVRLRALSPIEAPRSIAPEVIREEVRRTMQHHLDELVEASRRRPKP